jgi:hypothetical protein
MPGTISAAVIILGDKVYCAVSADLDETGQIVYTSPPNPRAGSSPTGIRKQG